MLHFRIREKVTQIANRNGKMNTPGVRVVTTQEGMTIGIGHSDGKTMTRLPVQKTDCVVLCHPKSAALLTGKNVLQEPHWGDQVVWHSFFECRDGVHLLVYPASERKMLKTWVAQFKAQTL